MLRFFIVISFLLHFLWVKAQEKPVVKKCATYESMQEFIKRNPNAETEKQFEDWMKTKIAQKKESNTPQSNSYTIPIIFHIVHDGEAVGVGRNLSAAKINSQLEQLNRDYANLSGSIYSVAANTEIQFCLAKIAPNGTVLTEPGIDRIDRNDKGWNAPPYYGNPSDSYVDVTIMPQSIWDPYKYFNVWTVELSGTLIGKSTFPASSTLSGLNNFETDTHAGVFIHYGTVGSISNMGIFEPHYGSGKNLAHETGHFFGLRHIWGELFYCWTDYCDDTPPQYEETAGCPIQPAPNGCIPSANKMFENYMDYTYEECKNTFTGDQKTRMQTVMENSPRRVELATSNVCCPLADLTIIGQSATPDNIVAGNSVNVTFAEDNGGSGFSAPNYVSFHLSSDPVLTPGQNGDVYLNEYYVNLGLPPMSQTLLLSKQVIIPSNTNAGTYYLFISADGAQNVPECNEQNNYATILISVSDSVVQSQVNRYRLWYDNSYNSGISYNIAPSNIYNIQHLISTNTISNGLHTLNFQFRKDTLSSSIVSTFFYKSLIISNTGNGKYEYWVDGNYALRVAKSKPNTANLIVLDSLDMDSFSDGLHNLNIRFKPTNGLWSSVSSSFFYKVPTIPTGIAKFQYWFDDKSQDSVTAVITSTNNYILLDSLINSLPVGLHTLNIRFKPNGGLWSSVVSNFFYKNQPSGISNNNIARCVYWYDNNWQNPNLLYYSGQSNLSSTINTDAADLSTGMHRVSMMFRDDRGVWSSVVSDSFNRIAATTPTCPINNREFISGVFLSNAATRQWQLDVGSGFVNIANNSNYSGTNIDTLHIINAPTSWYGYKYRCILTDGSNSATGQIYTLKFSLIWNGSADNAWENPANWNCTVLPDANTDVIINPGAAHYPEVNTSGTCRSLTANSGVNVTLKTGSTFIITH